MSNQATNITGDLEKIAGTLRDSDKKVQLIYAFNGTGKTRLSREFKKLIDSENTSEEEVEEEKKHKILYYNAFTEDLFSWDNDLENGEERKLKIQPNYFTNWVLKDQGQDQNIITHFQHYTNDKLTPNFNSDFSEIVFSLEKGNESIKNIKVSKGEESCLIWSIFYSLLSLGIETLNKPEVEERDTDKFNELEYIFIDDPVSSLDDNHLIELAVNIASLIKESASGLKFIITTHNPLFYNILQNEFQKSKYSKYRLEKNEDGTYKLLNQGVDSPFSYHLYLLSEIDKAIESGDVKKYHFNFLRNILEKTATFLGYKNWSELLPESRPGERDSYHSRILNLSSHSKHHGEEISIIEENDKKVLGFLVKELIKNYKFK